MMTGRLYIDGHDAYKQWGVYVVSGGWNELIAYPPLKTVEHNDWQEEDGIEADLSAPKLDFKEAALKFAWSGDWNRLEGFISQLAGRAYHDFDCVHIGRRYTLRMTQAPDLTFAESLGFITIKVCDDFPLKDYVYQAPSSNVIGPIDYLLDGHPLLKYGCRILQGSLSEIVKPAVVKQNLLRNIAIKSGVIYDDEADAVTFKSKDVKLNCLMRADSLSELWRNYDALLFNLIQPDERQLGVQALNRRYPCYYKNASVTAFYPDGKIWLTFTLTLTIINPR